uniref:Fasciclin-3 n=2 Tax=Lygus hesperus TaxID=30085 RepID=A0A0A9XAQ1_LYGHE
MTVMWAVFVFVIVIVQVAVCQRVVVPKDREQVVRSGEEANLLCQSGQPLDNCQFDVPSGRSLNVRPDAVPRGGLGYFGEGFEKGQCGLHIQTVTEEWNGVYICTVTPKGSFDAYKANMSLIVAKAPNSPELTVSGGDGGMTDDYKEGDTIYATCRINQGRPAANISWYIGDERITEGLQMPVVEEYKTQGGLSSVQQNISRRLQYSDNGKQLKCVGEHPLLAVSGNTTVHQLNVLFGPKPLPDFEHFGLVEGEEGRISVVVPANPRPSFTWYINDEPYYEGDDEPTKKYHALRATESREKGRGYWESTLVIRVLAKEDVDQKYRVKAENKYGNQQYSVVISTNPEPKVLDLGVGTIFVIVLAVLLVLIVTSLLVFARARGRWCFSGEAGPNVASESSDTESATERGSNVSKKALFKLTFKKNPAKSSDPQESPIADQQAGQEPKPDDEGVVYAELDLKNSAPGPRTRLVRHEDEKTEYAEILHSGKEKN